jgi:tRNA-dihydrouridine synthase A
VKLEKGPARHALCVAPMMERTDRHCRFLLRLFSAHAWLYTEMVTSAALARGERRRLLAFDPAEHPVALQLGGSDPGELARAADWGAQAGYDEINLNVGCPSDRVQAGSFGAALMRDPARVARCVKAMRSAAGVPVTVKSRLGVDAEDSYDFLRSFTDTVARAGCETLIVHARKACLAGLSPKQNREVPPLRYERVYRLKQEFPELEIVLNGGLVELRSSLAQLGHVDGVMLGRAAYNRPRLLGAIDAALFPNAAEVTNADVLNSYLGYVARELARGTPLKAMTRHLMGLYAERPGGRRWRRALSELPEGRAGLERLNVLASGDGPGSSPRAMYRYNTQLRRVSDAPPSTEV